MTTYYFTSLRNHSDRVAQGCINEIENVFIQSCNGTLLTQDNLPEPHVSTGKILFVIAISLREVIQIVSTLPRWRSRFEKVYAYVTDSFMLPSELQKGSIRRKYSKFSRTISQLDYLFISTANVDDFRHFYGINTEMIPIACDVVKFGSSSPERFIDVNGFGRQIPEISSMLSHMYNKPGTPGLYYHTDHLEGVTVTNHTQQRSLFWSILQQSKILLAIDQELAFDQKLNINRFNFSFVGLRWIEGLTAGCIILGRRPQCKESDVLLFWDDSTIELPADNEDIPEFISTLLEDGKRVNQIRNQNYRHALKYHDWRYRIADIHDILELEYPDSLVNELEKIRAVVSAI